MLKKYTSIMPIIALFVTQNLNGSQAQLMQKAANIELETKSWKDHYEQKLLVAAGDGSLAIVESLVQRGDININVQDEDGNTALMLAIGSCHPASAETLIEAGADFTLKNNKGITAFLVAVSQGEFSVAEKLMALGADVNGTNLDGDTALMHTTWSCSTGQRDFFIKLLARANNLYHKNNYGTEIFTNFNFTLDTGVRQALNDYEERRMAYAKHYVAPIIVDSIQELYPVLAELVADYYTQGGLPAEEKKEEEKHPSQEK